MEKHDIDELRTRVACQLVLDQAGFALDKKESTRKALKYRKGAAIVIVIHEGAGWFDPLSDAKGDVFSLASHLGAQHFPSALEVVRQLVGYQPRNSFWQPSKSAETIASAPVERWRSRKRPWRGSRTWRYLGDKRALPDAVLTAALRQDLLREGPKGSMWACHTNDAGVVTGWEERGPEWRGFATGGDKQLFRFGDLAGNRICVTEAAIDAMSLAALEELPVASLFVSTGGGWAPATVEAIRAIARRPSITLVAATDANQQGDVYAGRLETIAREERCTFERKRPTNDDWNKILQQRLLATLT